MFPFDTPWKIGKQKVFWRFCGDQMGKELLLKFLQYSQENTCVEPIFNKVAGLKNTCFEGHLGMAAFGGLK